MPKMNGIEATKIIKDMGYEHPIVVLTANAVVGQADIFFSNGFDDFIAKPIDTRQLNAVLNRLIRDKQPPEIIEAARRQESGKKTPLTPLFDKEIKAPANPQIIEAFLRDASKSIAVLETINGKRRPYSEEDIRLYDTCVHGMKSALASIGKEELSAFAFKLEMSVQGGNADIDTSETSAFIGSLRAVIEELTQKEATADDETADESQLYLLEKLLVIRAACDEFDEKTAHDAIAQLREKSWSQPTQTLLDTIAGYLLHSDFDEIVDTVNKSLPEA